MEALAVAAVTGIGLSTYSILKEGKQAAEAGKTQKQQYYAEAEATEQAGQYESREKRKEGQRAEAAQIAQISAQGGRLTGSKLSIVADTAHEYEDDALMISRNYRLKAAQLRNTGKLEYYKGQLYRRAARIRATANAFSTAGMLYLMGGVGKSAGPATTISKQGVAPTGGDIGSATMLRY